MNPKKTLQPARGRTLTSEKAYFGGDVRDTIIDTYINLCYT